MEHVWISIPTLFVITLGFARVLGCLIKEWLISRSLWLALLALPISLLVFASPLTLPSGLNWLLLITSMLVLEVYAFHPDLLPVFARSRKFDLRYLSAAMLLSAIWYLSEGLTLWQYGPELAWLMSLAGLITGYLSWQKSLSL